MSTLAIEKAKRSSAEKGIELETKVRKFLVEAGFRPREKAKFRGECGTWEVDLYLDTIPPVVIECKNPTPEAKHPRDSIRRKAQEAFLLLYDLKNHSELKAAMFVLVTGELELRSPNHDYEAFLRKTLGSNFHVIRQTNLSELTSIIPLRAASTRGHERL
jgi:hypothetical protein